MVHSPEGGLIPSETEAAGGAGQPDMFGDGPLLETYEAKCERAHQIVDEAVATYKLDQLWVATSFGGDSVTVLEMFANHPLFKGAFHIGTGIAVPEVLEYGQQLCAERGWPLKIYQTPLATYREWVLKHGFPGPAMHTMMYRILKERRVEDFIREHKTRRFHNIGILSGARITESRRRMGTSKPVSKRGSAVWINPILYFGDDDKSRSETRFNVARSPVSVQLGLSGECLCGAYADPAELRELRACYPATYDYIRTLERDAEAAGVHCKWGVSPPGQTVVDPDQMDLPLCTSCELRRAA
jgi:hypothetical protein